MELQLHTVEPGFVCLHCRGIISQPLDGNLQDPVETLLGSHVWAGTVLLDLLKTETIDSEGIAWLMRCQRRSKLAGGVFGLCAVPPRVDIVLRLCQMHRVLQIWEDESLARQALSAGASRPFDDKGTR